MRKYVIPYLLYLVYSALRLTWRIRLVEPPEFRQALASGEPMVLAHWHGDELGIVFLLGRYRAAAMTSTSKDGEIMNTVAQLFGARTSRGSSTRGGITALKGILRLAKEGWRPSIAVDGPKGPYHKVKPGVFEISRMTGGRIFPLRVVCDRAFVFEKSWNKSFLPKPFAKLVVVWGPALPAVTREMDARDSQLAEKLEQALGSAGDEAVQMLQSSPASRPATR